MTETLRERQRRVARDTILGALAGLVADRGSIDFSMAEVAERAGVSQRTVYNYFPSRDDLLAALSEWVDDEMRRLGSTITAHDLGEVADAVGPNFAIFDEISDLSEAFARVDTAQTTVAGHQQRTGVFVEMISSELPDLTPRGQLAIAALIRQLASVKSWYLLTREHGLTSHEAAGVVSWALRQLVDAIRRGDLPQTEEGED